MRAEAPVLLALWLLAAEPSSPLLAEATRLQQLLDRGDYAAARRGAEDVAGRAAKTRDQPALGRALLRLGDALYYSSQPQQAYAAYERAIAVYRALDDPAGLAEAYYNLSYRDERSRPRQMIATLDTAERYAA